MRYKPLFILLIFVASVAAQQRDLNYFVEKAKTNSPLLNQNKADSSLLELDYQQAEQVLRNPQISLESGVLFAPIISHDNRVNRVELTSPGATNYIGYDLGITNGGQFQAYVNLNQPIFTAPSMKTYAERKNISARVISQQRKMTVHEIEQLVGYQYILCEKAALLSDNNREIIGLIKNQLQVLQKLVTTGIYRQTDLLLLQIELQNLETQQESLKDDYSNNLYDLLLLCGLKDSVPFEIEKSPVEKLSSTTGISNFAQSYALDSLNLLNRFSLTELKYKPQVNLYANAGLNASYIPTFNRLGFSAGFTFSWLLYDGNQRKTERNRTTVNLQTLQFEKDHFMTQKELNLRKTEHQIESVDKQITLNNDELSKYDILYSAYSKELAQGMISVMDLKNLLKDIAMKKQEKSLLQMEKQLLINSYNYWNY